jgi:hypothetical protein
VIGVLDDVRNVEGYIEQTIIRSRGWLEHDDSTVGGSFSRQIKRSWRQSVHKEQPRPIQVRSNICRASKRHGTIPRQPVPAVWARPAKSVRRMSVHRPPDFLNNDGRVVCRLALEKVRMRTPAFKVRLYLERRRSGVETGDRIRVPTEVAQNR